MNASGKQPWLFLVGMTVISVAAYYLSVVGGLFFLLPLEFVRRRRGNAAFWSVSSVAVLGIVGVTVALNALGHHGWNAVDLIVLSPAFVFVLGWAAVVGLEGRGWRALTRITVVTAVTGVLAFPVLAALLRSSSFMNEVQQAFQTVWKEVFQTPGLNVPGLMEQLDPQQFFDVLKASFLGSFLLVAFLFWSLTWRISRAFTPSASPTGARFFVVPPAGTMVFLGLWGVLLLQALLTRWGSAQDWGLVGSALLNAGSIGLVVHLWAGWGIVLSLLDRLNVPRVIRLVVQVMIVFLAFMPGVGQIVVIVGLSLLAVMELWVSFRNRKEEVRL